MKKLCFAVIFLLLFSQQTNASETFRESFSVRYTTQGTAWYNAVVPTFAANFQGLTIQVGLDIYQLRVVIHNNSAPLLLLNWDKSYYMDEDGTSHGMMSKSNYLSTHKNGSRKEPDTHILQGGVFNDMVFIPDFKNRSAFRLQEFSPITSAPLSGGNGDITGYFTYPVDSEEYRKFAEKTKGKKVVVCFCLSDEFGEENFYELTFHLDYYKHLEFLERKATAELAKEMNLGLYFTPKKNEKGYYQVMEVTPGSIAENIGFKANDIVLDTGISDDKEYFQYYVDQRFTQGKSIIFLIERDGKSEIIRLKKDN